MKRIPKVLELFLLLLWVFIATIASQYLIAYPMVWILGAATASQPVFTTIYNALVYALALFLIIYVPPKLFHKWRTTREELGLAGSLSWTDLGLAPVGFFVYLILSAILTSIFENFAFFDANETQDVGYNLLTSSTDRIVAFIALVIIAPVAEEIIFRGWLYGKMRAKISGKCSALASMLLVSLLFGFVHGQWNVGVTVFAMSMVLCALREVTGSIYSGIVLHMLKNGVAFYLLYTSVI